MTGEVAILNVAAGDTKLSFDPSKPAEVKRSAKIVSDMIRRGFVLLIEVGRDEQGPIYRRAHDFDPKTCEYIVAGEVTTTEDSPSDEQEPQGKAPQGRKAGPAKPARAVKTRILASKAKATAVARTAGG